MDITIAAGAITLRRMVDMMDGRVLEPTFKGTG
jgi:hypothetical protein